MDRRSFRVTLATVAAVAALALVPGARAATWLPAQDISGEQPVNCEYDPIILMFICDPARAAPQAALAPDGRALTLWSPFQGAVNRIMYAERPPGSAFGAPAEAAPVDRYGAQLEVDAQGNAVALWIDQAGSGIAEAAFRPAGGTFGTPVPLSGTGVGWLRLAVAPDGAAVAVFSRASRVEAAIRPAGGAFGPATPISGTGTINALDVGMDAAGNAVALWSRYDGGQSRYEAEAAYMPAGGAFGPADTVSSADGTSVALDVNSAGAAAATFAHAGGSSIAFRAPGAEFGPQTPIAGTTMYGGPEVAIDEAGNALAAWSRNDGSSYQIEARAAFPDGSLGATAILADPEGAQIPELGMGPDGDALVAWSHYVATGDIRVQARFRPAGGAFQPVQDVFQSGDFIVDPDIAFDGEGNALLVWNRNHYVPPATSTERIMAAGFDDAPPRFGAVTVPAEGQPGQALAFAAEATDVWSAVTVNWDFGDGGTATGTTAEHAYAAPGTFTVTVTAVDATGLQAATTRTVTVTAAPAPPAPPAGPPDIVAPVIESLAISNRVFRVSRAATPVSAQTRRRPPRGTRFQFRITEGGTATLLMQRRAAGRRVGRRCVKPTLRNRKRRACVRWLRAGALTRRVRPASNTVRFTGRIGRRALRPGRYRMVLRIRDAAGNGSKTRAVRFTIVR